MERVQSAIFPGILFGSLVIALISFFLASPQLPAAAMTVRAGAGEVQAPAAQPAVEAVFEPAAPPDVFPAQEQASVPSEETLNQSEEESCSLSSNAVESVQRWCGIISRAALEEGIDPNLIAAVMTQESGGQESVLSHSGAVGLMQVMPRDGISASFMCINGPCFANRPSIQELLDPEFNVMFGTRLLAGLIRKYGDVREALAVYGPMNVGYSYADTVLGIYQGLK